MHCVVVDVGTTTDWTYEVCHVSIVDHKGEKGSHAIIAYHALTARQSEYLEINEKNKNQDTRSLETSVKIFTI